MTTYRMQDGTIVKTENAILDWKEEKDWNGNNWISRATGSQWEHETLYKTRKARYWLEHTSQWQGHGAHAEFVSEHEAVRWLLANEYDLPEDLEPLRAEIEE